MEDIEKIRQIEAEIGINLAGFYKIENGKVFELDLSNLELESLPESLGNFTALTELTLWGNGLNSLPENIGKLTALTTLNLGGNELKSLPASLGNLTALTVLIADHSAIQASAGVVAALRERGVEI